MAYTVHQAKTNFSRLLKEAEAGHEVIVTRGKKPVARLVPLEPAAPKQRVPGGFEGLAHADDSVFDPLTDKELVEYGFGFMAGPTHATPPDEDEVLLREQAE